MSTTTKKVDYSRASLLAMDPTPLRAMIRERAHHTVEIQLYEALSEGRAPAPGTGDKVRELLAVWRERGLPTDGPDFAWVETLLEMAACAVRGESIDMTRFAARPLQPAETDLARRLLRERRSVRQWSAEEVPDELLDQVLEAGLWAAHGCNLCSIRYIVVHEKTEPGLFMGTDIPGGPVHVIACQDRRVYDIQPGYVARPETSELNRVLDCGAAMENMVLMAHALGLGATWLTFNASMRERLRRRFALPEHIQLVTFLDLGYPAFTPMPPGRMPLAEVVLARI